jgi:hypothetical protein
MRLSWRSLPLILLAVALGAWGIWAGQAEAVLTSALGVGIALVWEAMRARGLSGADVLKRWRPSRRTLRRLAYGLAAFAALTAWGVYRGIIPGELVLVMLIFAATGPILAAPFLLAYWRTRANSTAAGSWPQTTGEVVSSSMLETHGWKAPIVAYAYSVDGRRYRRARVRFGGTGAMNPTAADQLLASCPAGAQIPVFYNPKRPGQAVLLPGELGVNKGLLWIAGLLAAVPLLGAGMMALFVLVGLIDAALTAMVGHRVLP